MLPTAAAIAARTSRIRIGTFVLLLPFHNPVRVAEDAICVDILSGGRFDLGVGQGYRAEEFASLNIPRRERSARMAEGIELIHRLFTERDVSFEGKYTQVSGLTLFPRPVQASGPPIWLGCRTAKATQRAARMGFNLMGTLGPDPAIPYRAALKEFGRNPDDYKIAQLRAVYVAQTADQAWEEAAPHLHYMMVNYGQWLAEANDAEGDKAVWEISSPAQFANRQSLPADDRYARRGGREDRSVPQGIRLYRLYHGNPVPRLGSAQGDTLTGIVRPRGQATFCAMREVGMKKRWW